MLLLTGFGEEVGDTSDKLGQLLGATAADWIWASFLDSSDEWAGESLGFTCEWFWEKYEENVSVDTGCTGELMTQTSGVTLPFDTEYETWGITLGLTSFLCQPMKHSLKH